MLRTPTEVIQTRRKIMDCRVVCSIFIVLTIILIVIAYYKSGDDEATLARKFPQNLCQQLDEPSHQEYLIENNLNNMQFDDNFTDIEVVSQNARIRAHKIVLAAHSKYFDSMIWIKNQTNPNDQIGKNQLDLSYVDDKTVSHVVNFIYTGSLPSELFDNETEYSNLLRAADEFQLDWLKCEITQRLSIRINDRNAGSLVVLAEETDSRSLMILASHHLLEHLHEISKTNEWSELIKNYPNILANAYDFQGKLPQNFTCNIQCVPSTVATPIIYTRLRQFFLIQRYADAEVHVANGTDKKVFRVNRAVLTAQSELFRQQFANSPNNSIVITDTSIDAAQDFLFYMYSSWSSQLKNLTIELLYLSDKYEMDALKKACEDIIINYMNVENAATLVVVADAAHSKRISSKTLDFMLKHRNDVVATNAWTKLRKERPELLAKIFSN